MNTSLFYESTLGIGDKLVHVWSKAGSHHLGNELGDSMYEANGAKIDDLFGAIFLGDKSNIRRI
jgi:hypothetical protein